MTSARTVLWLHVPPVVCGALAVVAYQHGYRAEDGSRAGAEPVLAGVVVALPFIALMCVGLLVAWTAAAVDSWAGTTACMTLGSFVAVVIVAQTLLGFRHQVGDVTSKVLSLVPLISLVPAWFFHLRERSKPAHLHVDA